MQKYEHNILTELNKLFANSERQEVISNRNVRLWLQLAHEGNVFSMNEANDASQAFLAILEMVHKV